MHTHAHTSLALCQHGGVDERMNTFPDHLSNLCKSHLYVDVRHDKPACLTSNEHSVTLLNEKLRRAMDVACCIL